MSIRSPEDLSAVDYPVRIEYDRDDALYVAEFLDLPGCSATGATASEAYERAQSAKIEWLRVALEQDLPIPRPSRTGEYSGRILVRLPASLHANLADRARVNGISLNQYIVHLLSAGSASEEVGAEIRALARQVQQIGQQVSAELGGRHRRLEIEGSAVSAWQVAFHSDIQPARPASAAKAIESARVQ